MGAVTWRRPVRWRNGRTGRPGWVAQLVERPFHKRERAGSNPALATQDITVRGPRKVHGAWSLTDSRAGAQTPVPLNG